MSRRPSPPIRRATYDSEHERSTQFGTIEPMFTPALCKCGCGEPAPIANETRADRGMVRGEPRPYRRGHHWRRDPAERFWEKVAKGDGCWEWQGARHAKGYGQFLTDTQSKAHRFSWELHFGPIPDGMQVCHHCDNPPCVRPDHLFLGTNQDNVDDAYAKGHFFNRGHRTPDMPRLVTPELAREILDEASAGMSQNAIARKLRVSRGSVQRVVRGTHWTVAA